MKKQKSAPNFSEASYNTGGLFGSSTTDKAGTTYTPTSQMQKLSNTGWKGWQNALNSLNSTDFSKDKNYQVYSQNLQNQMRNNYNNNVLNTLANNGLMRSSGLQASTNAFNDTLANQTANLYDSYYNRLLNNLAAYQNSQNSLWNYLNGVNAGSQNNVGTVNSYNLGKASANNAATANNNAMYATLASSLAGLSTSDMRAKKNIKFVGKENGFNLYEFEYKDGLGLPKGRFIGVIAQEVEKVMPDAVITINGIKHVDYNKIGIEMRAA